MHVDLGEFHGKVPFQIVSRDPDRRLDMHESNWRTVTTRPTDVYQWRLLAAHFLKSASSFIGTDTPECLDPLAHSYIPDHFPPFSFPHTRRLPPSSPASPTRVTDVQRAVPLCTLPSQYHNLRGRTLSRRNITSITADHRSAIITVLENVSAYNDGHFRTSGLRSNTLVSRWNRLCMASVLQVPELGASVFTSFNCPTSWCAIVADIS